ncbi:GXWXG protein-domain-containing protein [Penicillium digitatum]|uniref:GXWXG protein-domain-containing protein n=1 Tax=Penicillium digitatum TaxID=36651 RepID=A0A7T6XMN7_PENDI|nr:GXWXG protein-domain-containing protein [Penicillium digitatum]
MTIQFSNMPFDCFQPSPAKKFVSLTKNTRVPGGIINTVFHELKPLQPDDLIGEWDGYLLGTGHPFEDELDTLNWFGNTFYSTDDVAPLIVARNGERVPFEDWGRASLREIKFQGVVSATLVYDKRPMMVYYRAVKHNMVAGCIESKEWPGKVFFYLTK